LASLDRRDDPFASHVDRIGRAALAAGRFLAEHPRAGATLASGLRKWSVRGPQRILVYRLGAGDVHIIRLLDARSGWRAVFD
jgi:plasmid stabilization system protein ParE